MTWNGKLILAPHPDDELLWCSSVLENSMVIVVTSGDLGTGGLRDQNEIEVYTAMREQESRDVAKTYNVAEIIFLRHYEDRLNKHPDLMEAELFTILEILAMDGLKEVYSPYIDDDHKGHAELANIIIHSPTYYANPKMFKFYRPGKATSSELVILENLLLDDEQAKKKWDTMKELKTQWHWLERHLGNHIEDFNREIFWGVE